MITTPSVILFFTSWEKRSMSMNCKGIENSSLIYPNSSCNTSTGIRQIEESRSEKSTTEILRQPPMQHPPLISLRLFNQQISHNRFTGPVELLSWFAAMQAQEYQMAKWAIGLRLPSNPDGMPILKDKDIENAFNQGLILRTHLLRPTWHFVSAMDIRWLIKLTAPRVKQANAFMNRKMELDASIFKKTNDIIAQSLEGGKHSPAIA